VPNQLERSLGFFFGASAAYSKAGMYLSVVDVQPLWQRPPRGVQKAAVRARKKIGMETSSMPAAGYAQSVSSQNLFGKVHVSKSG
jgi:hypothetical protein